MKNSIFIFALILFFTATEVRSQELPVAFKQDTVFENISTIKISGYYSKINIKRTKDDNVRSITTLRAMNKEGYGLKAVSSNKALELTVLYPKENWTSHAGELTLYVPDSVNIDIRTTSGYCNVYDISPDKLNITTKSGKITINKCKGDILLASTSGDIFLDEITGSTNVKTKTGKIHILRTKGDVTTRSSLGNTRLENINGKIRTESTSGKQYMENIKGEIIAGTVSGFIKISYADGTIRIVGAKGDIELYQTTGILDIKTTKGNQTGTAVSLTGNSRFTSTEGKIKMRFNTPKENISYQLNSEKGFLFALGKSKKRKLSIGKGKILVEASSTTGTQSFF